LNSVPNSVLQAILVDLDLKMGNMDEQLGAFKAEEIARAKIAEANYNSFLEKQKHKTAPPSEEAVMDFSMEVISNLQRNFNPNSLKGRGDSVEISADLGALSRNTSS
jgi:hypothetical protein